MSLVSNAFVLFVIAAVILYYIVPQKLQWVVLLVFSYIYYFSGNAKYVFFILFSTVVTYGFALLIENGQKANASKRKLKRLVAAGIILNLGMLGVVKYTGFLAQNIGLLFHMDIKGLEILFPLGMSFYTFQSSGYLIDVYWRKAKAEHNFFRYALFVSFFPQLLQGPISNYKKLSSQLYERRGFSTDCIQKGLFRIIIGFSKKIIIADWAGVFVDAIWEELDVYNGVTLFALIFYGIQLYADFSGAMDVVIGIANLFGIELEENFMRPYLAVSMADFWKRWHITLGEWMMNYVFYPVSLSGWMTKFAKWSRKKFGRKTGRILPIAVADVIVFFLVGIWHGASWKYVMYGLLNGGIIAFSELMGGNYRKWKQRLHINGDEKWYHVFMVVRTFIIVNLRWFFDRSESLSEGLYMIKLACTHFDPSQLMYIPAGTGGEAFVPYALCIIFAGCAVMVFFGVLQERGKNIIEIVAGMPCLAKFCICMLLLVSIGMFGSTAAPRGFIYAQF